MLLRSISRNRLLNKSCIRFSTTAKNSLPSLNTQTPQPTDHSGPLTFHGNTDVSTTKEERMDTLFGGRIRGDVRVSSSRTEVGKPSMIAGVLVPARPKEPDNCCMSGCVNCVWEQYNDDIRDWRHKRTDAIKAISKTEEQWPANFDPPLAKLDIKNVPKELRKEKRRLSKAKRITTASYFPTKGKPGAQNIIKEQQEEEKKAAEALVSEHEEEDEWKDIPVSFRVFAQNEKRIKLAKLKKLKEAEEKKAAELQASSSPN